MAGMNYFLSILWLEDGNLYLRLWKNVAHNLCCQWKVSHIHRRMR